MREVSRARSTKHTGARRNKSLQAPFGKEQIHSKPLNPHYVGGFIDGEGSFCMSIGKHKTLKRGLEVRPEFTIELRADDQEILERICITIGCGRIYYQTYPKYGWYPHAKYKITNSKDLREHLFPFLEKYPLQAKKSEVYKLFKEIVMMVYRKEHLTDKGFNKIVRLRKKMRVLGKKARSHENR